MTSSIHWDRLLPSSNPEYEHYRFASRRSVVFGSRGIVACTQPAATQAGLDILSKGGNAVDAAIACAAALNVTEPCNNGIGGDVFALYWDPQKRKVLALNGSGRSPAALSLTKARELGIKQREIPLGNINAVTVPGAAAAWTDAHREWGSGKVSMSDILSPAIQLAENGFPVAELTSAMWQKSQKLLLKASANGGELLMPDKTAPRPGQVFRNPTLARTFRTLAEEGRDGFYKGRIAQGIVDVISANGGVMTLDDLARHESTFIEPIGYTYGEKYRLHECPPNGQGLTALIALGILDAMHEAGKIDLSSVEHNSTEYLHAILEAMRYAFADTRAYLGDPEHSRIPVQELLDPAYLRSRAAMFDPRRAKADVKKGSPPNASHTVYLSVSDSFGGACSFIQSNYAGFGQGAVPAGCGFSLQNRGSGFVLDESHPNCLAGNKRPYHTIMPSMLTVDDELMLSFGVMGGFAQPQCTVQVMLNMLHHGLHPQSALDAPRAVISPSMPDATDNQEDSGNFNGQIFLEDGISADTVKGLRKKGHDVQVVSGANRGMFGRGQIVQKLPGKELIWAAGSDPRGDGHAAPAL
ncbi:uncharacterized protein L969DRAFT_90789 [Mixia osmundae IAM 14324]|uniref:Gamma-glutamyltransferase n=1 Tax=Mixia osmundae (strain CBS 9802 / IAM 14324 / JCM 22182 / KY 12970) TaxID=764103 RepID=G7DW26_MIXOS|nr:uncharacterized protein L969DRAFT_90789 [Mixia osmundae IAM 14324]KEI36468.1 hypothetical protein L969DRAFT_90789 [Mixia osmundae IAM 14324]GAA94832.1 hypothetical protein E5Q_01486 [Mixia osmundae IAM 14324]